MLTLEPVFLLKFNHLCHLRNFSYYIDIDFDVLWFLFSVTYKFANE